MKPILVTITSAAFYLLLPAVASAQPDFRWIRFQDGYGKDDFIEDVHVDSAGNIYVAGGTTNPSDNTDYYIAKYDPAGNRLWYHLYDNGGNDAARSIVVKGSAVYVTGTSSSGTGFGANDDIVSFVLDTAGTIVPGNANALRFDYAGMGRNDAAVEILPAPDRSGAGFFVSQVHADTALADTFYVAGTHTDSTSLSRDLLLLMYGPGGLVSASSHHAPGDDLLRGMALDGEGGIYLGAITYAGGGSPYLRMVTVKYDRDLAFAWERVYANVDRDNLLGIDADATGVYVTGTSASVCGDNDVAVIAYAPDGTPRWVSRLYDCSFNQVGTGGILVDANTVYACGYHANGSQYFALDKSDGSIRYQADSPVQSFWNSLVRSFDGNVYAGGFKLYYDAPFDGVHLVKFDGAGSSLWDVRYDASGSGGTNVVSKVVGGGPDSSLVVVGSATVGGQRDMMILKYGVGESMLTGVVDGGRPSGELPSVPTLYQNYPNPFNPVTTLRFSLPAASDVVLAVYNLLGEEMARPVSGRLEAGLHAVSFDARMLPSGVYFCRLTAAEATRIRKILLLR